MKRYLKIAICVLAAVVLMLGALCIGTAAASEADVSLHIEGCSLAFDDSVYIMYASSYENIAAEDVQILYFTAPKDSEEDYTKANADYCESSVGTAVVNGKECVTFKNRHMYAQNMTDVVYARAYAEVGGVEYYSDIVKYSVLEYAYNMLGYTSDGSDDEKLHKLLNSMLAYGAAAQEYFDYKTDELATDDFSKITVFGGYLSDACTKGLYKVGTELTVTATPADSDASVTWYDSQNKIVGTGETLTITVGESNETYTARRSEDAPTTYTVTFVDYDGTVLSTVTGVESGTGVNAPNSPTRVGYSFIGWDKDFSYVTENLVVTAQYEEITEPIFIVESVEANSGDTVEVRVYVKNNPGILAMTLSLAYDDSAMTLTSASNGEALSALTMTPSRKLTSGCKFGWDAVEIAPEDVTDGEILVLTFDISDTATAGSYGVTISYTDGDIMDNDLNILYFEIQNGTISIIE